MNRSSRYQAIIIGKVPHSIAMKGDYSNPVEMFKQTFDCQVEDGRTKSGELKVTKTSYKDALSKVFSELQYSA